MRLDKKHMRLYAVTDRACVGEKTLYDQIKAALDNGVTCVQLREKDLDESSFIEEAKTISALCKQYDVLFIVNDNVNVAIACSADGIHLGQDDMDPLYVRSIVGEDMIIGVSTHTVEEAILAKEKGADYIGIGAVFKTSTKGNVTAISYEVIKSICDVIDIPKVAIGGVNKENISVLRGSGIDGVAVISAIFGADDIGKATKELNIITKELFL